jgi:hypothetical protein
MTHASIPTRSDVLSALDHVLSANKTGIFLIATLENASYRIAVQKGEITHCVYKRSVGKAAIQALAACMGGTWSFIERGVSLFKADSQVIHETALQLLALSPSKSIPTLILVEPESLSKQALPNTSASAPVNNLFYRGFTGAAVDTNPIMPLAANQAIAKVNNRFYRGS